jgi:ferredoxin
MNDDQEPGGRMVEPESISERATMRVFADRSRCCGYGLCAQVCPQVFKLDADGMVYLESDLVPVGSEEEAAEGAAACPAEALRVETIPS